MQHFMRGSMAGLSVLVGQTEVPEVIRCFHKCKENLEAPPMELLQPGMEILNNNGPFESAKPQRAASAGDSGSYFDLFSLQI